MYQNHLISLTTTPLQPLKMDSKAWSGSYGELILDIDKHEGSQKQRGGGLQPKSYAGRFSF